MKTAPREIRRAVSKINVMRHGRQSIRITERKALYSEKGFQNTQAI